MRRAQLEWDVTSYVRAHSWEASGRDSNVDDLEEAAEIGVIVQTTAGAPKLSLAVQLQPPS